MTDYIFSPLDIFPVESAPSAVQNIELNIHQVTATLLNYDMFSAERHFCPWPADDNNLISWQPCIKLRISTAVFDVIAF